MSNPTPNHHTVVKTEAVAVIQQKILEKRRKGWSFEKIGDSLGISMRSCYGQYQKALKSIIYEDVVEVRKLEIARLDGLYESMTELFEKATPLVGGGVVIRDVVDDLDGKPVLRPDGTPLTIRLQDHSNKFAATDRILRIMERRACLLGLDAAKRKEITGSNGQPIEFYQQLQLRGLDKQDLETMKALASKSASFNGDLVTPEDMDDDDDDENNTPSTDII